MDLKELWIEMEEQMEEELGRKPSIDEMNANYGNYIGNICDSIYERMKDIK